MAASVISSIPLVVLFLISMRTFIADLTSGAIKG
jgi:ABC-type maltose transport system permease subunit